VQGTVQGAVVEVQGSGCVQDDETVSQPVQVTVASDGVLQLIPNKNV